MLEAIQGWGWSVKEVHRHRMLAAVARFHAVHGPVAMPKDYTTDADPAVGAWMNRQRRAHRTGQIDADTGALLEAIPDFRWHPASADEVAFAAGLSCLRAYLDRHGHLNPPREYQDPDGRRPWQFIGSARSLYAAGTMPAEQAALLETLPGWTWQQVKPRTEPVGYEQSWANGLAAVAAFAAAHGHTRIP